MKKYEILNLYLKGISQRKIAKILGMSRNTISKYIEKYEKDLALIQEDDKCIDKKCVIESLVEKPKYDTSNRKAFKYNEGIDNLLDQILKDEERKNERLGKNHKQKLTKSQIHQMIVEEGYDI